MGKLKELFLWTVLILLVTPFAFILLPLIALASIFGGLATFLNRAVTHHHGVVTS